MSKATVYDLSGKQVGEMELSDNIFGVKPNKVVMHQAVVAFLANQRQGTQSALTRAEVSGGGKKPWKQKGTGRARQGSTRSPQWTHGGVAFAPKPRSYRIDLNRKVKELALKSALSAKALAGELKIVENFDLEEIKTRKVIDVMDALSLSGKTLVVTNGVNGNLVKSARNIPGVMTTISTTMNVYEILNHSNLVMTKDAVNNIMEVYA